MAVAVKTSPGARSGSPTASPAILSLIGVVYLLGCLAIVFKVIPWLWWSAAQSANLTPRFSVELGAFLVLTCLAAGVGLLIFGGRLLGPNPPAGVRGGVFVGLVFLLFVLLLARWATLWIEYWAYDREKFGVTTGILLSVLVLGGLVALAGRMFFSARAQRFAEGLEAGGWFHATSYKSNQGQKVRRATILGILLLVGAGVWTLINHGTLRRGSPDWAINIPFTGRVAIDFMGDAPHFLAGLPATEPVAVEVRTPGKTSFRVGQIVSAEDYRKAVEEVLKKDEALNRQFQDEIKNVKERYKISQEGTSLSTYVLAVNQVIFDRMQQVLNQQRPRFFESDPARERLRLAYTNSTWANAAPAVRVFQREAEEAKKQDQLGAAFDLPTGALVLSQYTLRDINDKLKPESYVRVGLIPGGTAFGLAYNDIVTTKAFGEAEVAVLSQAALGRMDRLRGDDRNAGRAVVEEVKNNSSDAKSFKANIADKADSTGGAVGAALTDLKTSLEQVRLPESVSLGQASGGAHYASIPLLPAVRYTVPLVLLMLALWMAWRIVNLPIFADFLIATEAELNKVSWTTQKRLFQDTIVVLVTVVLMAVFLFGTDWAWKVVLSWEPIGVLHIPKDQKDTKTSVEQKKW